MLTLKQINKAYGLGEARANVLNDINLNIKQGELIVILGPSGSGKTTLLNVIGGLEFDYKGKYFFKEEEINRMRESRLIEFRRKNIGFVYQGYNLLPSLTVEENIKLGYNLAWDKKDNYNIDELLELVGMKGYNKKYPFQLSGGEQQRVSIARAIAKKPNLLLADEPTGALDDKTSSKIMDLIKKLNDIGTTIVIVTHNNEIAKIADRLIKMNSGKIVDIVENK
ncbi:ABC transporter ATP-binding protein [Paenibacillus albiflavus]|uniref:ABC transporter ATP-binding protein n=1 Tax=Paenibacillus albiflavus TaxID=2545760 RepID=A0A4R4EGA4_9BACL|nr:ABC transporter ATP-binding protein [Paenibacillus albiflavus]TCZ77158.1 ABC transporter ATP-binding protein [Paenibacillus albiflavus]